MRFNALTAAMALITGLGVLSLTGCGSGDGDSARVSQTIDATRNTVTSVAIADNDRSVHYQGFYQFELLGKDTNGQQVNLTKKASWKISDPTFGTVKDGYFDPSGIAGDFTLIAEYAGMVSTQEINVSDADLVKVTISHPTGSVEECKKTEFFATAEFSNQKTFPYPLTWKVIEGAANATFKNAKKGTLSTMNSGIITVVATGLNNAKGEVHSAPLTFTVSEGLTKINVAIDQSSTELRVGDTAKLKVSGIYNDPTNPVDILDNSSFSMIPSDALKIKDATITAEKGSPNGTKVTLKATCGGAEGIRDLTVREREVKSIQIRTNNNVDTNLRVARGESLDLKATATFVDNSTPVDDFAQVVWRIDDRNNSIPNDEDDLITISESGEVVVDDELSITASINIYIEAEVRGNDDVEDSVLLTITP